MWDVVDDERDAVGDEGRSRGSMEGVGWWRYKAEREGERVRRGGV